MVCKTPMPGSSKTRLSPLLRPQECAELSACFIRDLAHSIQTLSEEGSVTGYAVYTPVGSEPALRRLLPSRFLLMPQRDGDLGARLIQATTDLLAAGHSGAILVNADSPTLPLSILRMALEGVRGSDAIVLSPALDGGYMLVGLSKPHTQVFENIPWSTAAVYATTLERAREIGLPAVTLPGWYDVDDEPSFRMLEAELAGERPPFAPPDMVGARAPATLQFLRERPR